MYHRIVSDACPVDDADERRYAVAFDGFAAHLDEIAERGQVGVSMERVHEHLVAGDVVPDEWVAITFDDGNRSDYHHALPLLIQHGFSATFYVTGGRIGAADGLEGGMITEMRAAGMHIGSHGMSHRFLPGLDARQEEDELRESRDVLAGLVGEAVDHFAPPGGRIETRTFAALSRLGYRAVATSRFGYNPARGARMAYRRIPVVASTSMVSFRSVLSRRVFPLIPAYARALVLDVVRGALGERGYGALRRRALLK